MNKRSTWKDSVLSNAYMLGLFEVGRIMRRNKIPILCYHRFASSVWTHEALSAELFDAHLRYLKKRFTVISFREMSYLLKGKLHVKNPLILTVDDGYKDFVEVALPLLMRHGVPATLFLTTRFIDEEIWQWPDTVHYAISKTDRTKVESLDSGPDLPLRTPGEKMEARRELLKACKQMKEEDKAEFLLEIADRLDVQIPPTPPPEFHPVTWEDLRELDRGLIEIGSHTLTHPVLSRVSLERAGIEIAESKREIERKLDCEVTAFAYPNGLREDYTERDKEIIKRNGYACAVTCNFGFNGYDADMFELNRIVVPYDIPRFVKEVSGFANLMQRTFGTSTANRSSLNLI